MQSCPQCQQYFLKKHGLCGSVHWKMFDCFSMMAALPIFAVGGVPMCRVPAACRSPGLGLDVTGRYVTRIPTTASWMQVVTQNRRLPANTRGYLHKLFVDDVCRSIMQIWLWSGPIERSYTWESVVQLSRTKGKVIWHVADISYINTWRSWLWSAR